jgi:hypothetical protein
MLGGETASGRTPCQPILTGLAIHCPSRAGSLVPIAALLASLRATKSVSTRKTTTAKTDSEGRRKMGKPIRVHTQNHPDILMPDVQIHTVDPTHVYVPLRGWSSLLLVLSNRRLPGEQGSLYNAEDNVAGWIDTRTLGYETAGLWIKGTGWRDQGY